MKKQPSKPSTHALLGDIRSLIEKTRSNVAHVVDAGLVFLYWNIGHRIHKDNVTKEQKAQVIKEITDTMVRVLGKDPQKTHVVIDEVELDNWGFAGLPTSEWRKKK